MSTSPLPAHVQVAVVGAGFAGLGMAARLRQRGLTGPADVVVLERAGDVGGTWRDNSYPGCACDIPSNLYSFSFAPNPRWTRSFSRQPEIQEYLRSVVRDFGLEPHLHLRTPVERADWDAAAARWRIRTNRGELTADAIVLGTGALAEPVAPSIPGLGAFGGTLFHSARWDHEHDLRGRRVAVIGTGASAVQFVPEIAPLAAELTIFQRTAPYVMPRRDRPVEPRRQALYAALPPTQRAVRTFSYWWREYNHATLRGDGRLRGQATELFRKHLAAQVPDPELRRRLTPDYELGCKRILGSNDWYPALTRPNVHVVTERITEVVPDAVLTADGARHEVDTIILGTGFHVADNPNWGIVHDARGRSLPEVWGEDRQAHRGTTVAGFPNCFLLVGPNTGLGHSSMIFMIESQVAYVLSALETMRRRRLASVEVRPQAQARFNEGLQRRLAGMVWSAGRCTSWYLDARGRNTTLWPTYTFRFRRLLRRFDAANYVTTPRRSDPAG